MTIHLTPQPGPQQAFLASQADIAIYGGSAGCGGTWAVLAAAAEYRAEPGYSGVVFRRHPTDLTGCRSIWELARDLYRKLGASTREQPMLDATWSGGGSIEFGHLQREKDADRHQGRDYAFVGFDQLTEFTEHQFRFLLTRCRSACQIRPRVRASTLPEADGWVRQLLDWWIGEDGCPIAERSGVLRWFVPFGRTEDLAWGDSPEEAVAGTGFDPAEARSLTFIPAKLEDNPILTAMDPQYAARLRSQPPAVRELLEGRWGFGSEDERVAAAFHEAYERLAPEYGYSTRQASAVPWAQVPPENKRLMIGVIAELRERGIIRAGEC